VNGLPDGPRVAAVSGASAGIGRAIAVALGGLGWAVAVGARRVEQLEETGELVARAGGTPLAHSLDVSDPASIDVFVGAVAATLGPVDVLVNNAGVAAPGALHEMTDDDHARILATNLLGPILLTKRVVASLRERRAPGDVVFISSDVSHNLRPYLGTYGVSKAGVEAFATVLALECEDVAIRSSIVRVGPTTTGFAEGWDLEQFAEIIPQWNRFGIQRHFNTLQPDDVARAVVSVVTAPAHMWMPVVEVQPRPPVSE
jgi:NAD(P)-dependent dehydrogenase (short-subunit alcohol dehydrogenase family)